MRVNHNKGLQPGQMNVSESRCQQYLFVQAAQPRCIHRTCISPTFGFNTRLLVFIGNWVCFWLFCIAHNLWLSHWSSISMSFVNVNSIIISILLIVWNDSPANGISSFVKFGLLAWCGYGCWLNSVQIDWLICTCPCEPSCDWCFAMLSSEIQHNGQNLVPPAPKISLLFLKPSFLQ